MNDQQWKTLVSVIRGETLRPLPIAFIIDSPWLPNWAAHTILDYFTSNRIFLLDDIVGFVNRRDFEAFGLPYLQRAFSAGVTVKFFHNDAPCKASAPTENIKALIATVEELTC